MRSPVRDADNAHFLAHSPNDDGAGAAELLSEHLRRVADRAARFAAAFGLGTLPVFA